MRNEGGRLVAGLLCTVVEGYWGSGCLSSTRWGERRCGVECSQGEEEEGRGRGESGLKQGCAPSPFLLDVFNFRFWLSDKNKPYFP